MASHRQPNAADPFTLFLSRHADEGFAWVCLTTWCGGSTLSVVWENNHAMQVMYSRDYEARRITVTTSGPVTLADILSNIDRQVREHAWTYATLYDTGDAESLPTTEEIDHVIGRVRAVAAQLGRRGALAIVTRNPGAFEIAREYNAIVEHGMSARWDSSATLGPPNGGSTDRVELIG